MQHVSLGTSGLKVSPLCLGVMMFGDQTNERIAGRIVGRARDAGVNFIDTADVYAKGESERITGKLVRADRHRWVLATKMGGPMGRGPNQRGLGRKWVFEALEGSLRRLGTDYVDIYYLHRDDLKTPLEETIGALGDLIVQGKIRYWAFSNFRAWRIAEMVAICDRLGVPRPVAGQPCYNLVTRYAEAEYIPACVRFGVGVVPYSPLARGVLTAKYAPGAKPPKGTRAGRDDKRIMETEFRRESLVIAEKVKAHARKRGMTPAGFALAWVLGNRLVSSAIAGPRTDAQWAGYLDALPLRLNAEDEAFVDRLVAPGQASTPHYADPSDRVTGRKPSV